MMKQYPNPASMAAEDWINAVCRIRLDDVKQLNELQSKAGYAQGFAKTTTSVSASYQAGITDFFIDVNATSGAVTVTLPPDPLDGTEVTVVKNDASGNAVTIDGGAYNLNGAGTRSLTTRYQADSLVFVEGAGEWRVR
jgi:hypothetical protein